ncbi:MAG: hypothetical protein ACLPVY_25990 [Acidimicrobiia bacterium]
MTKARCAPGRAGNDTRSDPNVPITCAAEPVRNVASSGAIRIAIMPGSSQLRHIRRKLRDHLDTRRGVHPGHIRDVELVADELVGAAFESGIRKPLTLQVELLARLTSVRVCCPSSVELRDEPFGIRERVLHKLAFACGTRSYADGSVDLWAEIVRPTHA